MNISRLELRWTTRIGRGDGGSMALGPDGIAIRTARRFLDFVVDGDPLYQKLWTVGNPGCVNGDPGITIFGWYPSTEERLATDRLLGEAEPETWARQCCLYVCPECGDINCGAISIKVGRLEDVVVWSSFAWEDPNFGFDAPTYRPIHLIGPYSFGASQLRDALIFRPLSDQADIKEDR